MKLNSVILDTTNTSAETLFWLPGMPYHKRITRFYELELITGGAGRMTIENKKFCTMRGNIFFKKPGVATQGIAGYYGYGIAFDPVRSQERERLYDTTIPYWITDKNTQIKDYGFFDQYPECYQTKQYEKLEPLFHNITNLFMEDKQKNQKAIEDMLSDILEIIDDECTNGNIPQLNKSVLRHYDTILSSKKYIDNNLDIHLSLDNLSAQCGLSKNFYGKLFKEITGMTPFEYIIESRMLYARRLILTTNINIEQIVNLCGFEERTYFYRKFKKRFGVPPAVYRTNYIESLNEE